MMKTKMLFIGPISPPVTGPGVKNAEILQALNPNFDILQISTIKKFRVVNIFKILFGLISHRNKIYSVSEKGRYVFSFINKLLKLFKLNNKSLLFVAGGSLDKEISRLPSILSIVYLSCLRSFDAIIVESEELKLNLTVFGLPNVSYAPNGRFIRGYETKIKESTSSLKLIFLSKVREEKGILTLMKCVNEINKENNIHIELDIFGVKSNQPSFITGFENHLMKSESNISYRGVISFDRVQETLVNYDAFVFPSTYSGEGMPGAVVEASIVGLPIITTNFRCRSEILTENKQCLVFDGSHKGLIKAIYNIVDYNLRCHLSNENLLVNSKYDLQQILKEYIELIKS